VGEARVKLKDKAKAPTAENVEELMVKRMVNDSNVLLSGNDLQSRWKGYTCVLLAAADGEREDSLSIPCFNTCGWS
jgi:hypothetical protein